MKTLFIFLITMCCFVCSIQAQKPFTELGLDNEVEVITLSNGRYIEHVENDTLRQIGSVMFNMNTNKIEYFIPEDDLEKVRIANRDREVSRFMAVDPLANKYPWNSPYVFSENKVIHMVELEGLESALPEYLNHNGRTTVIQAKDATGIIRLSNDNLPTIRFTNWGDGGNEAHPAAQLNPLYGSNPINRGNSSYSDNTPDNVKLTKLNLDNYGQYIIPGGTLLNKAVIGEEITWSDIGIEAAGLIPLGKILGPVGKAIAKSEFAEAGMKEVATFMRNNASKSVDDMVKGLEKGVRTHSKRIEEHYNYISNPKLKYGDEWNSFTDKRKNNIIHHWKQDIKRHEAYKEAKSAAANELKKSK